MAMKYGSSGSGYSVHYGNATGVAHVPGTKYRGRSSGRADAIRKHKKQQQIKNAKELAEKAEKQKQQELEDKKNTPINVKGYVSIFFDLSHKSLLFFMNKVKEDGYYFFKHQCNVAGDAGFYNIKTIDSLLFTHGKSKYICRFDNASVIEATPQRKVIIFKARIIEIKELPDKHIKPNSYIVLKKGEDKIFNNYKIIVSNFKY